VAHLQFYSPPSAFDERFNDFKAALRLFVKSFSAKSAAKTGKGPYSGTYGLEPAGAVELLLLFWVMHFCVQVNLGDFQRFVTEPTFDLH
jgi:hypothetical protein